MVLVHGLVRLNGSLSDRLHAAVLAIVETGPTRQPECQRELSFPALIIGERGEVPRLADVSVAILDAVNVAMLTIS